jgi:hypothetical protein
VVRLAILRREHPAHPDLTALALLADTLRPLPQLPANHATLTAALEEINRTLVPATQRLFGKDADNFLQPLRQALAAAASMPFDESYPRAHASWLCQQFGDWAAVRAAVEAEPDWATRPLLRYRLGLALHHLGDPNAAVTLWLPLCWIDPAFFARYAPTLPNPTVRDAWEAFEHAGPFGDPPSDATHAATWFPAWLLVRHRRLADLFEPSAAPDAGTSAEAFRALLALGPLERQGLSADLIAQRRALQRLSPEFFAYYMETLGGRRPTAPTRRPIAE